MKTYQLIEISGSGKERVAGCIAPHTALPLRAGRADQADVVFGQADKQVSRLQFSVDRKGAALRIQNTGSLPVSYGKKQKTLLPQATITVSNEETFRFAECSLRFEKTAAHKRYSLCLEYDDGHKKKTALSGKKITLGRGENNDLVVEAEGVSREHVSVEPLGCGTFRLVDQNSKNGVFVYQEGGEKRISDPVEIRPGERFAFGRVAGRVQEENPGGRKKKLAGLLIGLAVAALAAFYFLGQEKKAAETATVSFEQLFLSAWTVQGEDKIIQALDALQNNESVRSNRLTLVTNSVVFMQNQQSLRALLKEKKEQRIRLQQSVASDPWALDSYTRTDTSPSNLVEMCSQYQESYARFAAALRDQSVTNHVEDTYQTLLDGTERLITDLEAVEIKKAEVLAELEKWNRNPSSFLATRTEWWSSRMASLLPEGRDRQTAVCQPLTDALGEIARRHERLRSLIYDWNSSSQKNPKGQNAATAPRVPLTAYPPSLLRYIETNAPQRAVEVFERALASRSLQGDMFDNVTWARKLKNEASVYAEIPHVSKGISLCDAIINKAQNILADQTETAITELRSAGRALQNADDYASVAAAMDAIEKYGLTGTPKSEGDKLLRMESDKVLKQIQEACRGWYNKADSAGRPEEFRQQLKKQMANISERALLYCEKNGVVDPRCRTEFKRFVDWSRE